MCAAVLLLLLQVHDASLCVPIVYGCMVKSSPSYNSNATLPSGCVNPKPKKFGCTDKTAINYDISATHDNGSCQKISGGSGGNGKNIWIGGGRGGTGRRQLVGPSTPPAPAPDSSFP